MFHNTENFKGFTLNMWKLGFQIGKHSKHKWSCFFVKFNDDGSHSFLGKVYEY